MKLNLSTLSLLCWLLLQSNAILAQVNNTNPINNYISFTNECTHGMLIAHRILEGFNQKVNNYVDLQSNQFNFYGNKDLPKDLFEDPEHWFYPVSPNTLYATLLNTPWNSPHKPQLDALAKDIKTITQKVNQMRFTMEEFMRQNDLSQIENQVEIFSKLHHCASLYDRFYETNGQLFNLLSEIDNDMNRQSKIKRNYAALHKSLKNSMEIIRYGFDNELTLELDFLKAEHKILQAEVVPNENTRDMQTAIIEAIAIVSNYRDKKAIPEKYALYGPSYYYYNVELAAVINRYGKGFIANANKILFRENPNQILLLEEPHYFKVILPKKKIPLEETKPIINKLPSKLLERKVEISQTKIEVKDKKLLLEIFDHRKEDGDIISLNFNGKWILREKTLRKSPLKLIVELNDIGENYLLLHAENLGDIPPNTIAIRYYVEGERKIVVLNSDLNQSEMIRIKREVSEN